MSNQAGGLRLPDVIGPGEQREEDVKNKWDTFDDMELEMTKMGFPPVAMPRFDCPTLTADILTTADSNLYTNFYHQIEAWFNYAINTQARIKSLQLQIANEMNQIGRDVKEGVQSVGGKKPTVGAIADMVENHPRYGDLKLEDQGWEQKKILLQSHCTRLEKDLKLLSRQVEIRRQDWENNTKGGGRPQ